MKLDLSNVSLTVVETRCHELARMAAMDCLAQADFGAILYFSDQDPKINGATWIKIEDASSKLEWCRHFWHDVPQHVTTPHTLQISWDSWICNPEAWTPKFLEYDFIGAPWWYMDGYNVGNSGFSVRSQRLMQCLADNRERFPVVTTAEDELLCRVYRPALEDQFNFKWAPESIAKQFSFEFMLPFGPKPFGYHAMRNWPFVLDREALIERVKVAVQCPHVCTQAHLGQLLQAAPWLLSRVDIPFIEN